MISYHGEFSNEGHGTSECSKAVTTGIALPWLLENWWPQKYLWQGTYISHGNTHGKATSSHNMSVATIFFQV